MLVLSENVLSMRAYDSIQGTTTWENSELRQYLNNEFYSRFNTAERSRIMQTRNVNVDNQWFGTDGGNDTDDRVFLLSIEEVVRYFGDSGELGNNNWSGIIDNYNSLRMAKNTAGEVRAWLLRSPGRHGSYAARVCSAGSIVGHGWPIRQP